MLDFSRYPPEELRRRLARHLEAHPESTLFVRAAAQLLDDDQPAAALRLLERGLRAHPGAPGARLLLARCLIQLRRYREARLELHALLDEIPGATGAATLLARLPDLEVSYPPLEFRLSEALDYTPPSAAPRRQWSRAGDLMPLPDDLTAAAGPEQTSIPGSTGVPFPAETADEGPLTAKEPVAASTVRPPLAADPGVFAPPERPGLDETDSAYSWPQQSADDPLPSWEDTPPRAEGLDLEQLATRLETARIPALDPDELPPLPEPPDEAIDTIDLDTRPVTETLGSIYERQGRYEEAILVFRILRERMPDRAHEYTRRIDDLTTRLESGE